MVAQPGEYLHHASIHYRCRSCEDGVVIIGPIVPQAHRHTGPVNEVPTNGMSTTTQSGERCAPGGDAPSDISASGLSQMVFPVVVVYSMHGVVDDSRGVVHSARVIDHMKLRGSWGWISFAMAQIVAGAARCAAAAQPLTGGG